MNNQKNRLYRWIYMGGLMLGGESIYMLPYMRKTFQTTMEMVFQVSSTEIGLMNSMFGILALICYFPSGWIADRFSARKLLTFSLVMTSIGGFLMLLVPLDLYGLMAIHAFWGITSILTFWSALIKATRNWGSPEKQGTSFGLLDAGRGAVAAVLASLATVVFAYSGTPSEGFDGVLLVYSFAPLVAGGVIWFAIPDEFNDEDRRKGKNGSEEKKEKGSIGAILVKPEVWLLSLIIFCSYILYLGSYDLPAYAERAYGRTSTFGATLGTIRDWMRPIAAIGAGLIADRLRTSRTITGIFILLVIVFGSMNFIHPDPDRTWVLWTQVILIGVSVFGLRGVYFALLEEIGIPNKLTGLTVGMVSFIGFMPDIFIHLLAGWFVDNFEGVKGYHHYFGFLALVALLGMLAAIGVAWLKRGSNKERRTIDGAKRS